MELVTAIPENLDPLWNLELCFKGFQVMQKSESFNALLEFFIFNFICLYFWNNYHIFFFI